MLCKYRLFWIVCMLFIMSIFPVFGVEESIEFEKASINWQLMTGGTANENIIDIIETKEGNYLIAGYTDSKMIEGAMNNGHNDFYLQEIDASGRMRWNRMIGGNGNDLLYSITETLDGNYLLVGSSDSNNIEGLDNNLTIEYYVVKIDETGGTIWNTMIGGNSYDFPLCTHLTTDGGYLITGYSSSTDIAGQPLNGDYDRFTDIYDYYAVRLNEKGEILWERLIGGSGIDKIVDTVETSDGGHILAGTSNSTDISGVTMRGDHDVFVVKLDDNGKTLWKKMIGGIYYENIESVYQSNDGGCYLIGWSQSADIMDGLGHGVEDCFIIKLDIDGEIEWKKWIGGNGGDIVLQSKRTSDGGFIIGGFSVSTNIDDWKINYTDRDYYAAKVNQYGELEWQHKYGGYGHDEFTSIRETEDHGYIISGYTGAEDIVGFSYEEEMYSLIYIVKLNASGEIQCHLLYGGHGFDKGHDIIQMDESNYLSVGISSSTDILNFESQGGYDYYFTSLECSSAFDNDDDVTTEVSMEEYEEYAEDLSEIGVFIGSDEGFELDREATRIEGLILFIRLLGAEEEALSYDWEHPFEDVPEWADRYVGWAYNNGFAMGISENEFGAGPLQAKSLITFMMRALGYDDSIGEFSWDSSIEEANEIGLIKTEWVNEINSERFLRKYMARICTAVLNCHMNNSDKLLMDSLIEMGAYDMIDLEIFRTKYGK